MPTFDDLYNRIMTDSSLNKHNFTIEYKNFDKTLEMALTKWCPITKGGEIPTHKVVNIKFKGKIIWNKEKLCLIEECIEEQNQNNILGEYFNIVTFNVLSDEYEKTITNLQKRLKSITDFVNNNYDIICLQEVQPLLLTELSKINGLYVKHTTIGVNDIAIVTKIECESCELIDLGQQKSALLVTLALENEKKLHIVGVHLTSDYHDDNSKKRTAQLYKIKEKIQNYENVIILGDTNEYVYLHSLVHFTEYVDCWMDLKNTNEDKGFTYDPIKNSLAHKMSRNKSPLRLDRILYTKNNCLLCEEVNMISDITFSDHYPIVAKFKLSNLYEETSKQIVKTNGLTNQTALCIIPPYELWNQLNQLKISNANNLQELRWMHHLNLFFGFVQPDDFYLLHKKISQLNLKPFDVTFDKISYFQHEKTFTVYLKPNEESFYKLVDMYKNLKNIFNDNKLTFTPHISLGNTEDEMKVKNYTKQQININFTIDSISFVSRVGFDHFKVLKIVPLKVKQMNFYINFVKTLCQSLGIECKVCGSRIFGLMSDNNSDADLLCIGNMTRDVFLSKIIKVAETCGYFKKVYIVKNKYVYCLKLKTHDNNIDIQYVNQNETDDIYYKTGMAMYNEPKFMVDILTKSNKFDLFKECLNWTKTKLKNKNMYGGIFGFVGGLSVSILVAYIVKKQNVSSLQDFINELKNLDYSKPISLGQNIYSSDNPCDRLLYIGTATSPIENTMRHVCKSTAFLLKSQFESGFEFNVDNMFKRNVVFTINAIDDDSLYECIEWFNGMVTKIMVGIERNTRDPKIVLFPSTTWSIQENYDQIEATWKLQSLDNYTSLNYTAERIVDKSKQLFTKAFLSYV